MKAHPVLDLVLLGGGGHAREVAGYLHHLQAIGPAPRLLGVIDEVNPPGPWEGSERLGDFSALHHLRAECGNHRLLYLAAVGANQLRQALVAKAEAAGLQEAYTLVHPMTSIGRDVVISAGTLLAPGCIVTTTVRVGRHCILNVKTSVSHHCVIGDFACLCPGSTLCGNVRVGEGAFIGAGATVINGVSVGRWTVVGAGAVVVHDLPDHVTAVGVPARIIKHHAAERRHTAA